MIARIFQLLPFLILVLSLGLAAPQTCQPITATRHEAWDSVFANFPDRLRSDVHGYIATDDCAEMGRIYQLQIDGKAYTVSVADCRNRSLPKRTGPAQIDLDDRIWRAANMPNRPTIVSICSQGVKPNARNAITDQ